MSIDPDRGRQLEIVARARTSIPGGVNSGQRVVPGCEDLVVAEAVGARFRDVSGRWFTDYHAAFGPPLLGHNDPDVNAAVVAAITNNDLVGVGVTEYEVELAEKIVTHVPSAERVLLTVTGSEATFHAIRLARAATGRSKIIKFQGCYHGWHDAVAMNVISPKERVGSKDPLSAGMMPETVESTIVAPFNDLPAVEAIFSDHAGDIAAVIIEPIPHNVGALLPREGFLRGLRELTARNDTVLIFDEVITGVRHGLGGFQVHAGVTPDLTTLGKALGNGFPVSALCGDAELLDLFSTTPGQPVFFAGTFNGHPATTAAALATIEKLEEEPVHDHVFRLGERVRAGLSEIYRELGVPAEVRGFGSVFVGYFMDGPVENYLDLTRNDQAAFVGYRTRLLEHGIFELPLNLKRSHISYAHSDHDVDVLLEATSAVAKHLVHEGILNRR